eukprot:442440-Rhodomonas_salina.2
MEAARDRRKWRQRARKWRPETEDGSFGEREEVEHGRSSACAGGRRRTREEEGVEVGETSARASHLHDVLHAQPLTPCPCPPMPRPVSTAHSTAG